MPGEDQEGASSVPKIETVSSPETMLCEEYAEALKVDKAVAYRFAEEKGGRLKPVQGETVYVKVMKKMLVSAVADLGSVEKTFVIKIEPYVGTKKIQERAVDQFTGMTGAVYDRDVPDNYVTLSATEALADGLTPVEGIKKYPKLQVPMVSPEQGGIGIMIFGRDSHIGGGVSREPGMLRLTGDPLFVSTLSFDMNGQEESYRELSRSTVKEIRVKKKE